MAVQTEQLLSFRGIVKRFGGTLAVDNVDLDLERASILALLGENGAGKSTLIKILAGVHPCDSGEILFRGRPVEGSALASLPFAFIHQDLGLIEWMTAAENIALVRGYSRRLGLIDWTASRRKAAEALEIVGGDLRVDAPVAELSRTERSLLAIARALATEADVLVLDEPTASLPEADVSRLFDVLGRLRERGVGMIYVTHRIDEVFRIADRVAVMRDGRLVGSEHVSDTNPAELVRMIVGRPLTEVFTEPPDPLARPMLELDEVQVGRIGPISFRAMAGEVLGLAGLRGAGQNVIGRALCGLLPLSSGSILVDGQPVSIGSPGEALRRGLGFVTSNREAESLAMTMGVRENLFLNPAARGRRLFDPLLPREERRRASSLIQQFTIRPPESERPVSTLSGGNQQKVALARCMGIARKVLVLEDPTMGVDVGAKAEIYGLLNEAMASGLAAVIVSSDFEEIAHICNRAIVFNRGRIAAELGRERLSMESLTHAASVDSSPAPSPAGVGLPFGATP